MILGNHDYHSLIQDGFDISSSLKNSRYDLPDLRYVKSYNDFTLKILLMATKTFHFRYINIKYTYTLKNRIIYKYIICRFLF